MYALESLPCNKNGYDLISSFDSMKKVFQELYGDKHVTKNMVDMNLENIGKLFVGAELNLFESLSLED